MAQIVQIQMRRDSAADWTSENPTLAAGELGYETDTGKFKIGNGSDAWADLSYQASVGISDLIDDATPQLGGPLDVNGQKIVSVSNGNIDIEPHGTGNVLLGNLTFDADQTVGAGQDNYVLTYDHAAGTIALEVSAGGGGGASAINDLSDVTISGIASGELLQWNGTAFINRTLAEAGIAAASHTHGIGDLTIDADDIDDAATTNKFATSAQLAKVDYLTVTQAVDLDAIETRVNQLDSAVVLKGSWDASAGTFPGSGSAQAGDSYIVSVGGTVDGQVFTANDRIVAITDNASTSTYASNWLKLDYTDAVLSVAGKTGAVTLAAGDIASGTFDNARIAEGNVTQHQAALSITESQISDFGSYETADGTILKDADIGSTVQAYDADTLKADTADQLAAGFTTTAVNEGELTTFTPDLADGNVFYVVNNNASGGLVITAPSVATGAAYSITVWVLNESGGTNGAISISGTNEAATGDSFTTTASDVFAIRIEGVDIGGTEYKTADVVHAVAN